MQRSRRGVRKQSAAVSFVCLGNVGSAFALKSGAQLRVELGPPGTSNAVRLTVSVIGAHQHWADRTHQQCVREAPAKGPSRTSAGPARLTSGGRGFQR